MRRFVFQLHKYSAVRALAIVGAVVLVLTLIPSSASAGPPTVRLPDFKDGVEYDYDRVYFPGGNLRLELSGFNSNGLPDGTSMRVYFGIITEGNGFSYDQEVLEGLSQDGNGWYAETQVMGDTVTVIGVVNSGLPPGVLCVSLYIPSGQSGGWDRIIPDLPLVDSSTGESFPAIVGVTVPSGDIIVQPGLEEFNNLYDTDIAIEFEKQGLGSIEFEAGLNIIENRDQLMQLQDAISLEFADGALRASVDTETLEFLADHAATIVFYNAMAKLGLTGVTADNILDYIAILVTDNDDQVVPEGELSNYLDLEELGYDSREDMLIIPVKHFTSYIVKPSSPPEADTTPPEGSITINDGDETTNSRTVTLTLTASDDVSPTANLEMRFRDNGGSWTGWEPFSTSKDFELTAEYGKHTVEVEFRDEAGNISDPVGATIELVKRRLRLVRQKPFWGVYPPDEAPAVVELFFGHPYVRVDGRLVDIDAQPYVADSGSTMVPVRFLAELLGGEVTWHRDGTITVTVGEDRFNLRVGSATVYFNSTYRTGDYPVTIVDGRAYMPVRLLAKIYNLVIGWVPDEGKVRLLK